MKPYVGVTYPVGNVISQVLLVSPPQDDNDEDDDNGYYYDGDFDNINGDFDEHCEVR